MAKLDLFLKGQNGTRPNLRGDLYNPANAFWEVQDSVNFLYDTSGDEVTSVVAVTYGSRRPTAATVTLDGGDLVTTSGEGGIKNNATWLSPTEATELRVWTSAQADDLFRVVVDPDATFGATLERTDHVLTLTAEVSGTTLSGIDTRFLTVGWPIAVYRATGASNEDGDPVFELVSNPAAVIASITTVAESGQLEMNIVSTENTDAEELARVEVEAGEQGLINGGTAPLTLEPGSTTITVIRRTPWVDLLVEGPDRGRVVIGTQRTTAFAPTAAMRGQIISVASASPLAVTLNALPQGVWLRLLNDGTDDVTLSNGTATGRLPPGLDPTIPPGGSALLTWISETVVDVAGFLEETLP